MAEDRTKLGGRIEASLREALAHRRGDLALRSRVVNTMPPERVKAIRKAVAKSTKDFEAMFGIPARTIEGWEQGRKLDVAGRVLLTVIEREAAAVKRALDAA